MHHKWLSDNPRGGGALSSGVSGWSAGAPAGTRSGPADCLLFHTLNLSGAPSILLAYRLQVPDDIISMSDLARVLQSPNNYPEDSKEAVALRGRGSFAHSPYACFAFQILPNMADFLFLMSECVGPVFCAQRLTHLKFIGQSKALNCKGRNAVPIGNQTRAARVAGQRPTTTTTTTQAS